MARSQKIGAAAGLGVRPVHLAALVVAVVVQAGLGVLHVLLDVHELLVAVNAAVHPVAACLILHVEGLGHVGAVQPDLVGIDLLVPEVALLGAGLGLQLAADRLNGVAVALVAGQVVQRKQVFALVDVVQVVLGGVVGLNDAVVLDKVVQKLFGEVQKLLVARWSCTGSGRQ